MPLLFLPECARITDLGPTDPFLIRVIFPILTKLRSLATDCQELAKNAKKYLNTPG
jgi:hypothetical protein